MATYEPTTRTRRALKKSDFEWSRLPAEEQTALVEKELWVTANFEAYQAETGDGAAPAAKKKGKKAMLKEKMGGAGETME